MNASPCESCKKGGACKTSICMEWKEWFSEEWHILQVKFGVKKEEKKDGQ